MKIIYICVNSTQRERRPICEKPEVEKLLEVPVNWAYMKSKTAPDYWTAWYEER